MLPLLRGALGSAGVGLAPRLGIAAARRLSAAAGEEAAPLHFAVVGSGPAGFYTALQGPARRGHLLHHCSKLLKRFGDEARVDILDALPSPFGLVRSGVAPDHADTKNVINQFTAAAASDPRLRFFGNVTVGAGDQGGAGGAVTLPELRRLYSAVVLAYGAQADKPLGVPGEGLPGVFSAREFVAWYNGHPHFESLPVDLHSARSVAIAGLGNVAVDCARVLLRPAEEIAATDAAAHAVAELRRSGVTDVHLIGRRGPAQAAFTPKELRELLGLPGVRVAMNGDAFQLSEESQAELAASRPKRRVFDILEKARHEQKEGPRTLHLHFQRAPVEVLAGPDGRAAALRLERTRLAPRPGGGGQSAEGTGRSEDLPVQLVLRSIGYRALPLAGAPFDEHRGVVPNVEGQVLAADGRPDPTLFVCGWAKRGPTGIIGTNLTDAEQTVARMLGARAGFAAPQAAAPGGEGLAALLQERGVQAVGFPDWLKVDSAEVAAGAAASPPKPREKVVSVEEMLRLAAQP